MEGFVHIMRNQVELAIGIQVDAIVAGSHPVSIAIDQGAVQGQEPERAVDIEHRFQGSFEFIDWRFVERLAELDQVLPGLFVVIGLDGVTATIILYVVA